jgi:acetyl-CoA carboxylase biotin carboxyl carrier protein
LLIKIIKNFYPMAKAKKATPKKAVVKKAVSKKTATPSVAKPVVSKVNEKMPLPIFNINEINDLINAVNHSNVNELKLEKGDFKITIRQGDGLVSTKHKVVHAQSAPQQVISTPVISPAPAAPAPASTPLTPSDSGVDNLHTIKSPMIGTFYRSSGPGKPLFVNVGDDIKEGDVLCIVEAMKLFNEIESEVSGKVVKILVDDNSPVEYDQPLLLVQLN